MRKTKDVCKENSAITLIALIITIIVLLILAGVTINAITGADSVLQKGKEAAEKNELGEIRDLIALGMNNILLESNAMQVDEYYKDVNSFITYGKINKEAYIIEDYEFDNPIVTGKISKNNGIGVEYEFEINISTKQIALQKSEKEILVESSMGYFKYSEPDENGNVKITGLTSATDVRAGEVSGEEAYQNDAEDILNLVIPKKSPKGNNIIGVGGRAFYDRNKIKKLVLQKEITSIETGSFSNCSGIEELTLPITLNVSPAGGAFLGCKSVTKVKFTPGTGTVPDYSKNNYHRITPWFISSDNGKNVEIIIEKGVTSIGKYTFRDCVNITSISIPSTLTQIDEYAFYGCTNLAGNLGFVKNLTQIGQFAFYNCSKLTGEVTFSSGLEIISGNVFKGTGITKLILPPTVKKLESGVFSDCNNMQELTLPITLNVSPAGGAFLGCKSVTKVKFTPGTGTVPDYSKNNYHRITPWFISSDNGKNVEIIIEKGVTSIGKYTFRDCVNITSISIPSTLTQIDEYAFYGCTNLAGNLGFVKNLTQIGQFAFYNCSKLTGEVTFSSGLEIISGNVFKGTGITKLILPPTVKKLESGVFSDCNNMQELIFPITLDVAPTGGAFLGCKSVTKVRITPGTGTVPSYINNRHKNTPWFISSNNGSNIEIKIDEGVTNIGEDTFNGCSNIKKIILPSTLNILNSTAFKGVTNSTNYYRGSQTDWEAIEGVDQSHITINQYNYTGD